jgi:hypothetical protein
MEPRPMTLGRSYSVLPSGRHPAATSSRWGSRAAAELLVRKRRGCRQAPRIVQDHRWAALPSARPGRFPLRPSRAGGGASRRWTSFRPRPPEMSVRRADAAFGLLLPGDRTTPPPWMTGFAGRPAPAISPRRQRSRSAEGRRAPIAPRMMHPVLVEEAVQEGRLPLAPPDRTIPFRRRTGALDTARPRFQDPGERARSREQRRPRPRREPVLPSSRAIEASTRDKRAPRPAPVRAAISAAGGSRVELSARRSRQGLQARSNPWRDGPSPRSRGGRP